MTTRLSPSPLRVLVVDDERPALDELAWLLERDPRVGSVTTTDSFAPVPSSSSSARLAVAYEPTPRTRSLTSAVAPSKEICTST